MEGSWAGHRTHWRCGGRDIGLRRAHNAAKIGKLSAYLRWLLKENSCSAKNIRSGRPRIQEPPSSPAFRHHVRTSSHEITPPAPSRCHPPAHPRQVWGERSTRAASALTKKESATFRATHMALHRPQKTEKNRNKSPKPRDVPDLGLGQAKPTPRQRLFPHLAE